MSTKTTFKRIALVAVAALGLSLVAVAPSTAAAPSYSVTAYAGGGVSATTATAIAGPANYVTVTNTDGALSNYVTVTGGTFTDATVAKTVGFGGSVFVSTPTAGTITVKITQIAANGVADTVNTATLTITVLAAIVANIPTAANSTSFIAAGAAVGVTADATILSPRTVALQAANITVSLKDANGVATTASSLSATVSGPGVLGITHVDNNYSATAAGRAVSNADTDADGIFNVAVYGDGNAGVATITISTGTTVIATETVTFSGPAASFKVASTTPATVVKNLGIGDSQQWQLNTLDSAGNLVSATPNVTITVADTTIATSTGVAPATPSAPATGLVSITGVKAGTTTFTVKDTATGLIVLGPVTVNVSAKSAVSATFALDKTDYAQGEVFTLTITAKEANGLPLADGTYTNMATLATSALVYSNTVTALGGLVSPTFAGGVATIKGFMPVNSATVAFSLTLGTNGVATAAQGAVLTANATVSNPEVQASQDAAAEATDAANAATDAANAAAEAADAATAAAQDAADAVAALSTEVAAMITALKKQITALTNLVIKIQKKVRA